MQAPSSHTRKLAIITPTVSGSALNGPTLMGIQAKPLKKLSPSATRLHGQICKPNSVGFRFPLSLKCVLRGDRVRLTTTGRHTRRRANTCGCRMRAGLRPTSVAKLLNVMVLRLSGWPAGCAARRRLQSLLTRLTPLTILRDFRQTMVRPMTCLG